MSPQYAAERLHVNWPAAASTWARYRATAAAVAELLSPEAVMRTHAAAHQEMGALLARGQADGS